MASQCSREAQDANVSDHKLREQWNFCVRYDNLITCEAGEAIGTSRGSRLCSYAKISLYPVHAACSTDHRVGEDAGSESQGGGGSETD